MTTPQAAPGSGLVVSAITPHDHETAPYRVAAFDAGSLWKHAFPSPEMVGAAASMFRPAERVDVGPDGVRHEGPRWIVTVAGGLVAVNTCDWSRSDRTHERNVDAHRKAIDADALLVAMWADIDPLPEDEPDEPRRGRITGWSRKSRANMFRTMCVLDYTKFIAWARAGRLPAVVTLTSPGDWLAVFPTARDWRAAVERLKTRYRRSWGESITGIWKDEYQRREAPHCHIWMSPPHGRSSDKYAHGGLSFREWLSLTWADCTGASGDERRKHILAGTGVDYAEGLRATDPLRAAAYFLGHNSAGGKEYQHRVPEAWQETGGPGRYWGYWGVRKAEARVEVEAADGIMAARLIRRHAHAQRVRVQRSRPRGGGWGISSAYPEVVGLAGAQLVAGSRARRRRKSGQRQERLRNGRGWSVVNDGASFGADVARYLELRRSWMEERWSGSATDASGGTAGTGSGT